MSLRVRLLSNLKPILLLVICTYTIIYVQSCQDAVIIDYSGPVADWKAYGGNNNGERYSSLTQINTEKVAHL